MTTPNIDFPALTMTNFPPNLSAAIPNSPNISPLPKQQRSKSRASREIRAIFVCWRRGELVLQRGSKTKTRGSRVERIKNTMFACGSEAPKRCPSTRLWRGILEPRTQGERIVDTLR